MVIFSLENKFLRRWLWQKRLEIWLWCLEMISIQIMMGMIQLLSILMVNTLILLLQEYCYLPAAGCSSGQHQQDWYYSDKLLICRTEAGPSRRLLPAHLVCNLPILVSKEAGWGGRGARLKLSEIIINSLSSPEEPQHPMEVEFALFALVVLHWSSLVVVVVVLCYSSSSVVEVGCNIDNNTRQNYEASLAWGGGGGNNNFLWTFLLVGRCWKNWGNWLGD